MSEDKELKRLEEQLRYLEVKKKFFSMDNFNLEYVDKEIEKNNKEYQEVLNSLSQDNNEVYTNPKLNEISLRLKDLKEQKNIYMELLEHDRKPILDEIVKNQDRISELKDKHANDYNGEFLDEELNELSVKQANLKKQYNEMYSNNIYLTITKRRYLEKKQFKLSEEIFNKKTRIKELQDKYINDYNGQFLDEELNSLVREVPELEEQLATVEKELEKYYVRLRKLQSELKEKRELFDKLKARHNGDNNAIYLDEELSKLLQEIRELEDAIAKENNLTSDEALDKEIEETKKEIERRKKAKQEQTQEPDEPEKTQDNPGVPLTPGDDRPETPTITQPGGGSDGSGSPSNPGEGSNPSDPSDPSDPDNSNPDDESEEDEEISGPEIEHNSGMSLKSIAALAGGMAVGLGLSFVIQPGTAGLVISVGRLAYSLSKKALTVYTEKHKGEDTKIMQVINAAKTKANDFKENFKEKHPKISNGIRKINNFLKKPETQVFINGVAAGYTIGKITQFVDGLVNANPSLDPKDPTDRIAHNPDPGPDPGPVIPDVPEFEPVELNPGGVYDLSGIDYGYVGSGGVGGTTLETNRGVGAVFDRFVTDKNGVKWAHFFQKNGAGYAWFKAEDVEKVLNAAAKTGGGRVI